jgi:c-di-GMP-binding flagellar brake protein YcgR
MDERRAYPRMRVDKNAACTIENRFTPLACNVDDISLSGVRITMSKNLFPEAFSNITLDIPETLSFNVGTHVAWHDEYEGKNTYGLAFNRLDDGDRDKIAIFIKDNLFKTLSKEWWRGL